ncbi:hypothetical protein ACIGNX_02365 [Actinosynnema sp. NPDC053489]|uniref:hypothetical protein n=1 Tax=Actinosynnema sp. NPDC053489 TaxID=3363916 RepID=UPI0037CBFF72
MTPDELADALRRGPFHLALRAAIEHRGLSLARLRRHLARLGVPVAESTLSYWQRGLRHPDARHGLGAVRALEAVLGLPPDALVVLVGPRRGGPRGRRHAASFAELVARGPVTRDLYAEVGVDPDRANADVELLFVHERVTIDEHRAEARARTRIVGSAQRAGVDRYLAVYQGEPGVDAEVTAVSAVEGCRLGRVRRKESWVMFELLLDRRLGEGETFVLAYEVDPGSTAECPGYFRLYRRSAGPLLVQLELSPDALPARITQVARNTDALPPTREDELFCDRLSLVNAYFPVMTPGLAGIALDWT